MDTQQRVTELEQIVKSGKASAEQFVEYARLNSGYSEEMALRIYGGAYQAKFDPEYGKTYVS